MYVRAGPPILEVVKGCFVPILEKSQLAVVCLKDSREHTLSLQVLSVHPCVRLHDWFQGVGMIGCTVMPFNIFLHSFLVQSRPVDRTSVVKTKEAILYYNIETSIIVVVSKYTQIWNIARGTTAFITRFESCKCSVLHLQIAFLINLCIVCVFAVAVYGQPGANQIGLWDAADVLSSHFGFEVCKLHPISCASWTMSIMPWAICGETLKLARRKREGLRSEETNNGVYCWYRCDMCGLLVLLHLDRLQLWRAVLLARRSCLGFLIFACLSGRCWKNERKPLIKQRVSVAHVGSTTNTHIWANTNQSKVISFKLVELL